MPKFKKRMLEVGRTYESPDGKVPVTKERLQHWSDTFGRFKAKGLKVPSFLSHQDDPKKIVPRKRLPKDVAGKVTDISTDGKYLDVEVEVPSKEIADKMAANLLDLSPVILKSWQDGDGVTHADCITDIDLVTHPVDHRQGDFVACALRMGLPTDLHVWRLQVDDDGEETAEEPEVPEVDEEAPEGTGDEERLQRILEGLAKLGLVLSPDTTADNLMEHLEQAILTAAAIGDGEMGESEELQPAQPEMRMMSTKPNPEMDRLRKRLDKQHQESLLQRLSLVLERGQCTPPQYEEKKTAIEAVRLSLNDDGENEPSNVEAWIADRETLPAGTFWSDEQKTQQLSLTPVPQPAEVQKPPTPAEAKEIAQKILKGEQ